MIRVVLLVAVLYVAGCAGSSSRPEEFTGAIAFIGDGDRVFTVDAADSEVTRVGRRAAFSAPSWTPDGANVVYASGYYAFVVASVSGDGERRLRNPAPGCYTHVVSPDGTRIACGYAEPEVVSVIDIDDGALVAQTPQCCTWPAWSPDSRQIAYQSYPTHRLHVMDADGGNRRLLARKWLPSAPAWSSRGTIAFFSGDGIWTVRSDGTGLRRLVPARGRNMSGLAWSPDGTKLAFVHLDGDGDWEIFVVNADGSGLEQLTDNKGINDGSPSWSPDGRAIAFASTRDERVTQIFAMRADGSGQTQLTSAKQGAGGPSWSPVS